MNLFSKAIGWLNILAYCQWNRFGKYKIWVYVQKYFNIAISIRISPRRLWKCYLKCNSTLLQWDTDVFYNGLRKNTIKCLRVFFLYIDKHIRLNIGPVPLTVRPSEFAILF